MSTKAELTALEEVFGILESVPLDPFNSYRLKKELADARGLFMAAEMGEVSDAVVREVIRTPVQLSLLVIEQQRAAQKQFFNGGQSECELSRRYESLYNFVAQYFLVPCEMRIARVEDTLREGIDLFSANSIIPMELGKAYIRRTLECVHRGNSFSIPRYLAKVQEYLQIAAQRSQSTDQQKTGEEILDLAYSILPGLRGTRR